MNTLVRSILFMGLVLATFGFGSLWTASGVHADGDVCISRDGEIVVSKGSSVCSSTDDNMAIAVRGSTANISGGEGNMLIAINSSEGQVMDFFLRKMLMAICW